MGAISLTSFPRWQHVPWSDVLALKRRPYVLLSWPTYRNKASLNHSEICANGDDLDSLDVIPRAIDVVCYRAVPTNLAMTVLLSSRNTGRVLRESRSYFPPGASYEYIVC